MRSAPAAGAAAGRAHGRNIAGSAWHRGPCSIRIASRQGGSKNVSARYFCSTSFVRIANSALHGNNGRRIVLSGASTSHRRVLAARKRRASVWHRCVWRYYAAHGVGTVHHRVEPDSGHEMARKRRGMGSRMAQVSGHTGVQNVGDQ